MVSKTNEEALESTIEKALQQNGYVAGNRNDFNARYALMKYGFGIFYRLHRLKRWKNYNVVRIGNARS